ncbi:MAG TPA: GreA/GreB family elongation factor [Opitutus sp.]|nr:GreA/GreB family elongation factor [Opitutus sp.]
MNDRPLYMTTDDYAKLRLIVDSLGLSARTGTLQKLRAELDRAVVLDPKAVPANVVTMNSRVEIEDLATGEVEEYTLTFPERANVEQRMLSVLAPIGTAILGYTEGDQVDWNTPGGVRRLRIRHVARPSFGGPPEGQPVQLSLKSLS